MFELDYLTQRLTFTKATDTTNPRLIGGYAPTFEGEVVELPVASAEPLAAELDAFLGIVRDGGRPVVDAEDGLWAVAIATSCSTPPRAARRSTCPACPRGSHSHDDRLPPLLGRVACWAARSSCRRTPAATSRRVEVSPWTGEPGTAGHGRRRRRRQDGPAAAPPSSRATAGR